MTAPLIPIRIGAVSFLNAVPLVAWFSHEESSRIQVQRNLPSRLSGLLAEDQVDVALLPVVEIFRGHSGGMFPGSGIAGFGNVDSVKLLSSGPLDSLVRVRADRGSRSSVALLEILFRERFGRCPDLMEAEPIAGEFPGPREGLLVIGDRCFQFDRLLNEKPRPDIVRHDMGQMWFELTGLPFVFAAWAVSPRFAEKFGASGVAEVGFFLRKALDFGLDHLTELAQAEAAKGQLGFGGDATAEAIDYYFRKSLRYELGEDEMKGLVQFRDLCQKHGLIDPSISLKLL